MSDDEDKDPMKGVVVEVPGKGFILPLGFVQESQGKAGTYRYRNMLWESCWAEEYKVHRPKGVLAMAEGTNPVFVKGEVVLFEWSVDKNEFDFSFSRGPVALSWPNTSLAPHNAKHWKIIAVIGGELAERQPNHLPEGPLVLEIPDKGFHIPERYFPECGAYQYREFGSPEEKICLAFDYEVHHPTDLWLKHHGRGIFRANWSKHDRIYRNDAFGGVYHWHMGALKIHKIVTPAGESRTVTASPEAHEFAEGWKSETMKAGESVKAEPPLRLVRSAATSTGAWYVVTGFDEGKKLWKGKSSKSSTFDFPEGTSRVIEPAEVVLEYHGTNKPGPLRKGSIFRAKVDGYFFRFQTKEGNTNLMNVKAGSLGWKITEAYTAMDVEARNAKEMLRVTNNVDVGETIISSLIGIQQEILDRLKKDVKWSMYAQIYGGRPPKLISPAKEDLTKEKFDSMIGKFLENTSPTRPRLKGSNPEYPYFVTKHRPYMLENYCGFFGPETLDWPESVISFKPPMKQEKHPMKIETVVQINGQNSSRYSTDELLDFIKKEKDRIAELKGMNVNSEKVESMIAEHTANVDRLIAILDGKALPETK